MNANTEEKLSGLLDDELDKDESLRLLGKINRDDQLLSTWQRYQQIGHVLREGHAPVNIKPDFMLDLQAKLADEPLVFAPNNLVKPVAKLRLSTTRAYTPWAMAASFVAVAFGAMLLVALGQKPAADINLIAQNTSLNASQAANNQAGQQTADSFMVTHSETVYRAGSQGMFPYARVVTYTP